MLKQIYNIGNKEVTTYIPKKTNTQYLKKLYDVCNEMFSNHKECFYSKAEVKELKKDKTNIFIGG